MEKNKMTPLKKFGIWMGVIFVMIVVGFIKNNNESHFLESLRNRDDSEEVVTEKETKEYRDYSKMQATLRENNYDYVFKIDNSNKYTYTGTRCNGLESGFKESQDGVIKYIIGYDKKTYKVVNDEYIEIDDLYDGFDANYLIVDKIFNDLSDKLYELEMDEDKAIYKYNLENYSVTITSSRDNIGSIVINKDDVVYNLEFTNIGSCTKIEFNN